MVALLVQSAMGLLSDHSRSKWGRRRPFIFAGTLLDMIMIAGIGFSVGLQGTTGFWSLFVMALLLSVSSNTAHAAQQGLIPDLVPLEKQGVFSAVKTILELPVPILLVSFTIGRMVAEGEFWAALVTAAVILLFTMLITMLTPERIFPRPEKKVQWMPLIRLVMMTAVFTTVILSSGYIVRWVGTNVIRMSTTPQIVIMGLMGLAGMLTAVALGVWLSIQISFGRTKAARNPSFTWWVVNRLMFLVGATNLTTFIIYFIQARLGFDGETAAKPAVNLMLLVGVFILLSALPAGRISDKIGKRPVVFLSGILAAAGTFLTLSSPSLTTLYMGGIIIGTAAGLFYVANWALGTSLVPKNEAGHFLGISNLAGAGAGAVGAYIGGPIADFFTTNVNHLPGLGYIVLFAVYGFIFLISVLALKWIKEPIKPV